MSAEGYLLLLIAVACGFGAIGRLVQWERNRTAAERTPSTVPSADGILPNRASIYQDAISLLAIALVFFLVAQGHLTARTVCIVFAGMFALQAIAIAGFTHFRQLSWLYFLGLAALSAFVASKL
jgi:hypothetical protein